MLIDIKLPIRSESLPAWSKYRWWFRSSAYYDPAIMVVGDDDSYVAIFIDFVSDKISYLKPSLKGGIVTICLL